MNLQYLAEEYKKLQQKVYFFGLENGETIFFEFSNNDFYHLLGLKKFTTATVVKMIEDEAYYKERFYKDVLHGRITFEETKVTLKGAKNYLTDGKFVNFCDVEVTENIKRVLDYRFPYFSYNNVISLLKSELVILYNKEKGLPWNKVDADRIFFKLITNEDRNLYFFTKRKELSDGNCPISFFREENKDTYIKTNSKYKEREQEKAEICYRVIKEKQNSTYSEFVIFWNKLRFWYSRKSNYSLFKAQIKLQEYFKNTIVKSLDVKELIDKTEVEIELLKANLDDIEEILKLIEVYITSSVEDEKVNAAINLMEKYDIDIMEKDNVDSVKKDFQKAAICEKEELAKKKRKNKKIIRYLPDIIQLEKTEITYVFKNFVSDINLFTDSFVRELIEKEHILDMQDGIPILQIIKKMENRKNTK